MSWGQVIAWSDAYLKTYLFPYFYIGKVNAQNVPNQVTLQIEVLPGNQVGHVFSSILCFNYKFKV